MFLYYNKTSQFLFIPGMCQNFPQDQDQVQQGGRKSPFTLYNNVQLKLELESKIILESGA